MKKTIKHFLSIAALALVGAMMTGCSSNEDLTNEPVQQPEVKDNIITQTITVGFEDDDATTRALTLDKENPTGDRFTWEPDKRYIYYLQIQNLHEHELVLHSVAILPWDEVQTTNINVGL